VDWAAIQRTTEEILSTSSKDLLVAARLTESLTRQHGLAGLAEGMEMLRRLVDEAWDRLHPAIEDGDAEVRAAPFNWLGEGDRGARFPVTVRSVPLVMLGSQGFGWLDWKRGQEGRGGDAEAFDQAVQHWSRKACFDAAEVAQQASDKCAALVASLNDRLGEAAPSMEGLAEAIDDCLGLIRHILSIKGGPPDGDDRGDADGQDLEAAQTDQDGDPPAGDGHTASARDFRRAAMARTDVYRRLAEVGEDLRVLEPHSPVPFLIRKAVQWGSLSFPELIRVMSQEEGLMQMLSKEAESQEEGVLDES
jgi:type VI secretion system protein ImpA